MRTARIVIAAVIASAALAGCTSTIAVRHSAVIRGVSMPRYYVTMAGATAVVRNPASGRVTGSVRLPVTISRGEDVTSLTVSAAGDRHFVIEVSNGGDLPGVSEDTFYTLSVSAGGRPGTPAELHVSSGGVPVTGVALSPDGTMLALSLMHEPPLLAKLFYGDVEVIDLRTGASRKWSGAGAPDYWPGVPFWAGDRTLDVPWWHGNSRSGSPADVTGIRQLDASAAGGSLLTARLIAFPAADRGLQSAVITSGGAQIDATSCSAGRNDTATARVVELSAADGRLVRVLRSQTATFRNAADAKDAAAGPCSVLSADATGRYILVQAFAFGRIADGSFSALPSPAPGQLYVSAAW